MTCADRSPLIGTEYWANIAVEYSNAPPPVFWPTPEAYPIFNMNVYGTYGNLIGMGSQANDIQKGYYYLSRLRFPEGKFLGFSDTYVAPVAGEGDGRICGAF